MWGAIERLAGLEPDTPAQAMVLADGVLRYRQEGDGPPVVLIHGMAGSTRWWSRNVAALRDSHTVYRVDLLGWGASRGNRFSLATAADTLATWHDRLGLETAAYVGHSMGGFITTDLATRYPELVSRLVLVNGAVLPLAYGPVGAAMALAREATRLRPAFIPILTADSLRAGPFTFARATAQLALADLSQRVTEVRCPSLLIWGARDALVPVEMGRRLHRMLPRAELVEISGAGHNPMFDRPAEFNAALTRFLSDG
ncbi:MAG: alpha/beta hydrolase [Chloroflexota bacterium]